MFSNPFSHPSCCLLPTVWLIAQVLDVVVPIKDLRQLTLNWPLPPARAHYRVKPASLLSHLIGHEGVGSLLSALKTRGWATSLSAGTAHSFRQFSTFGVSIDLTEDGLRHCDDIAQLVFGCVG